eukprot:Sspe_Gene.67467::Locus_39801_Transcript_2_8_Confidence_0.611_Length_885::g.67467::m.67467
MLLVRRSPRRQASLPRRRRWPDRPLQHSPARSRSWSLWSPPSPMHRLNAPLAALLSSSQPSRCCELPNPLYTHRVPQAPMRRSTRPASGCGVQVHSAVQTAFPAVAYAAPDGSSMQDGLQQPLMPELSGEVLPPEASVGYVPAQDVQRVSSPSPPESVASEVASKATTAQQPSA